MRERERQSGLGRNDGRHEVSMLVTDCSVRPDHLPKEKCNKTNLRYLYYIVQDRIVFLKKFGFHRQQVEFPIVSSGV